MKKQTEIILKKQNISEVEKEIKSCKKAAEQRFNVDSFNIPEVERCIDFLQELIYLHEARSIMQTSYYKAYEESGKRVMYSEFLSE